MFNTETVNKLYDHYKVPSEILFDHHGLKIPFNPEWKRIAVNLSGGADSALGTSVLANHIKENGYDTKIYVLTHVRCWDTRPWAGPVSIDVYNKLKEMWGDIIVERIQNYIPPEIEEGAAGPNLIQTERGEWRSGDRTAVDSFNRYALHQNRIDAAYNFVTLNPLIDLHANGYSTHAKQPHDRLETAEQAIANPEYQWMTERDDIRSPNINSSYGSSWLVQPWKYMEKDFIMSLYYRNGWLDLLHTTRSCEVNAEEEVIRYAADGSEFRDSLHGYKDYVHGESPLWECGNCCFWCSERTWAKDSAASKLGIDVSEFNK